MDAIHVEITGRVQGVGFRWFVRDKAPSLGLSGWVRNRHDGNVEVAAAGDAKALQLFRSALSKGPSGARVDDVRDLQPVAAESLDASFEIVR